MVEAVRRQMPRIKLWISGMGVQCELYAMGKDKTPRPVSTKLSSKRTAGLTTMPEVLVSRSANDFAQGDGKCRAGAARIIRLVERGDVEIGSELLADVSDRPEVKRLMAEGVQVPLLAKCTHE
jgi:hypothetical protein